MNFQRIYGNRTEEQHIRQHHRVTRVLAEYNMGMIDLEEAIKMLQSSGIPVGKRYQIIAASKNKAKSAEEIANHFVGQIYGL